MNNFLKRHLNTLLWLAFGTMLALFVNHEARADVVNVKRSIVNCAGGKPFPAGTVTAEELKASKLDPDAALSLYHKKPCSPAATWIDLNASVNDPKSSAASSSVRPAVTKISFTQPTARADGTPLALSEITGYRLRKVSTDGKMTTYADLGPQIAKVVTVDLPFSVSGTEVLQIATIADKSPLSDYVAIAP